MCHATSSWARNPIVRRDRRVRSTTYGVTFPLLEKTEVNGENRHPLYEALTQTPDASGTSGDIEWNFEKFLVGADGEVRARFRPQTVPDDPDVTTAIEAALQ